MRTPKRYTLPLVLAAITGCGVCLFHWTQQMSSSHPEYRMKAMVGHAVHGLEAAVVRPPKTTNILLIANNARGAKGPLSLGTAGGQADILLVVQIDASKHTVTLISVPRDTLVAMPMWQVPIPKIKTVFTVGLQQSPNSGPELQAKYVSKVTGLPIHDYIVTDFDGFTDAIDSIGGIRVNIPARLFDPQFSGVNLQAGSQTLNGRQALAFVRVRQNQAGNSYRVNDYQRQQSEMLVLKTLKGQLLDSAVNPLQLMKLVEVWRNDFATNLSTRELVRLGLAASDAKVTSIQLGGLSDSMNLASAPLPGVNAQNYLVGAYYDVLDPNQIARQLKPIGSLAPDLGLPNLPAAKDVKVRLYGPRSKADVLRRKGFYVEYGGVTWNSRSRQSTVFYPIGQMPSGWVVARALGSSNAWVAPSGSTRRQVIVFAR